MEFNDIKKIADEIKANIGRVIVGKDEVIEQLLIAIIAGGNILLEDVPGMGKTLMSKALAKSLECKFNRIQFTPDLLPTDVTGLNFYNQKNGEFEFMPGPVFTNILLADEINRATPRTQAALLECMEEHQVTIDGLVHNLEEPFLVIATQNPIETRGTFPLPEAQLDRFLLKISVGYPKSEDALKILSNFNGKNPLSKLSSVATTEAIIEAQKTYTEIYVSEDILKYIVNIVEMTRDFSGVLLGVSPRGSQALLRVSQIKAILDGRDYVSPDDVKAVAHSVLVHRMVFENTFGTKQNSNEEILNNIIARVIVPSEDKFLKKEVK